MNEKPTSSQARREAKALDLPSGLRDRLEEFRRRLWIVKSLEGLLAAAFGLVLSYLLVFGLDRAFDTPGWLRIAILITGASLLGILFPLKFHRWVWRQRRLEQVARLLKHRYPRLGDQLLGIVELAHDSEEGELEGSETLVRAAMAQVDEKVRDKDLSDGVPHPKHRRWGWAAATMAGLALAAMIIVPAAGKNALVRWLMPWKDTDRYTFAQLEELEETRVVPKAEFFELRAELSDESPWKPEAGSVRYADQAKLTATRDADDAYVFPVPPQTENGRLAVRVGDDRHRIAVVPKPRPELQSLSATLRLPDYLRYDHDPEIEVRGGAVSVVKGAHASFEATATSELATATMDGEQVDVEGARLKTPSKRVTESSRREFHWRDRDGLEPKEKVVLRVDAVDDARPTVSARKMTREQVILDSEVINFELDAGDDFGVRQVGLEWQGIADPTSEREPAKGDKLAAAGEPQKTSLQAAATFSARREGVEPQTLQIRAFAEDYYPNGERGYSPVFIVHILSPDEHALWLTEQFGRWFRQSQEVYEQEQLLHDTNREIREMPAEDLDRPENRRRIEDQAAAEQSNAQRLGRLTDAGEELVRQALRNEEFDANALERWARMLEALDAIAGERMPSVADLLKKAAEAAGQPNPGQATPPGKPGKPGEPSSGESQPSDSTAQAKPPSPGSQSPPTPQGPKVVEDKSSTAGGPSAPTDPDAPPKPQMPSISDVESGFNEVPPKEDGEEPGKPKPPGGSRLTLPQTQLAGGQPPPEEGDGQPSPAQQGMDAAIEEQELLLAEFAKIADELQELLSSLEASTFVKRLKAASRRQMEMAGDLNGSMLTAFGLDQGEVEDQRKKTGERLAEREIGESETVQVIQTDLEAYFQRKQDGRFQNILEQMKETDVVAALREIGDTVKTNLNGRSIVAAEFWADHLDRWAEELVAASKCKACEGSGDAPSLPPELVLKVMKILHDEIALREETRELESAKAEMRTSDYGERARSLAETQRELKAATYDVAEAIFELPDGPKAFEKEIQLLDAVAAIMEEARQILATPETGAPAIAAETEVIEMLLQAKRFNPNGGGGGGGSSPGGGGTGTTSDSALARLGSGTGRDAAIEERAVGQATGSAGREFPAEFRDGLDSYFNRLERQGGER